MDEGIQCVNKKVRSIIAESPVPEDPEHAENTVQWLTRLDPRVDCILRMAALGHDIDRALEIRRIKKADFADFDVFKAAHALNSAQIMAEIMAECGIDSESATEVRRLVALHETGGDERSNLLKNADSLSYFEINLPFYYKRNGRQKTVERSLWGYARLSATNRGYLRGISYSDPILNELLQEVIRLGQQWNDIAHGGI